MSKNLEARHQFIAVCVSLLLFVTVPSCRVNTPVSKDNKDERERAVSALDEMYDKYLSGTPTEARSNMLSAISLMHSNCARIPELQGALRIGYERLSLLERKVGNEALSRVYFEKSRYWLIYEDEQIGRKPEVIISDLDSFTRDESDKEVIKWDNTVTKGVGPAYLKQIR
ncbi:MAG TPA: hypothetical protein VNU68_22875 [Verrucomicrobiae bacterium]|nr:hypothetical protein [Verrucomicrobiae bacterium]